MERKLASIRRISKLEPIEGADKIEVATVDGWKVVVEKNKYYEGDLVLYFEIDSWVPVQYAPFLVRGKNPREYNGVPGEKLRTVRLRKQISQGLILPLEYIEYSGGISFWYVHRKDVNENVIEKYSVEEGDDVTEYLGIQKWEAPIPTQLAGVVRGNFPSFLRKTDQERLQNYFKEVRELFDVSAQFEITEKMEGSSMTVYYRDGDFGVCSRNLDLKEDPNNTFWKVARDLGIEESLRAYGRNIAIQGELVGPGVQDNIYKLKDHKFLVFDIFDIQTSSYVGCHERYDILERFFPRLEHVPVLSEEYSLQNFSDEIFFTGETVQSMITFSDGPSYLDPSVLREGLVYKTIDGQKSFKVISNQYLEKEK